MKKFALAVASLLLASTGQAATVLLSGTNFDVTYDDSLVGLYGTPSISGNVIFFTPTEFKAESTNGGPTGNGFLDNVSGTVNMRIIPKNDFVLGQVTLQERGDYVLLGANSAVSVTGQTRAFTIANPLIDISDPITATGSMSLRDGVQHNWTATSSLNLASLGILPNQAVNYTIENILRAYTRSSPDDMFGQLAFIEKKFSGFQVTVSPVPEPSAIASLLVGLGLLGFVVQRRSKVK